MHNNFSSREGGRRSGYVGDPVDWTVPKSLSRHLGEAWLAWQSDFLLTGSYR